MKTLTFVDVNAVGSTIALRERYSGELKITGPPYASQGHKNMYS